MRLINYTLISSKKRQQYLLDNIKITEKSNERRTEIIKEINELKAELRISQNSIDNKYDEINKYKNLYKHNSNELKLTKEKLKTAQEKLKEAQANLKVKESDLSILNNNIKDSKERTAELINDNSKILNYQCKEECMKRKVLNELNNALKENNQLSKSLINEKTEMNKLLNEKIKNLEDTLKETKNLTTDSLKSENKLKKIKITPVSVIMSPSVDRDSDNERFQIPH